MTLLRNIWYLCDRPARVQFVLLMAMMVVGALLEAGGMGLIMPFIGAASHPDAFAQTPLAAWVMGHAGLTDPRTVVVAFGAIAVAANLAKNAFNLLMSFVQYRVANENQARLSRRLFTVYLQSAYAFHLDRHSARLQRNLTAGVRSVVSGVMLPLLTVFVEVSMLFAISALLFLVEPVATLAVVLFLGGFTGVFYAVVRMRLLNWGKRNQREGTVMTKAVNQGLGGIKETKIRGVEEFFVDKYAISSLTYARTNQRMMFVRDTPRSVIESTGFMSVVGLVVLMLMRGDDLAQVLPKLGLFAMAGVRLMPSFTRIMGALTSVRFARPEVDTISTDLRNLEGKGPAVLTAVGAAPIALSQDIRLEGVQFRYASSVGPVLDGVDLVIPRGKQVAFVGTSGAGKTTIVDVILGLLELQGGRVLVDGVDIATNLASWQRKIGYISQPVYLMDDTVRRNIAYGQRDEDIDDDRVWAALADAQLDEFVRAKPGGLDATIGEHGVRVSGGQRQRIGIARALYPQPEVLVLDEATSALDNETEREIISAIGAFRGRKTIITIAHRLTTVRDSDCLYFLRDGKLVDSGTYDDLLARCEDFGRMVAAASSGTLEASEPAPIH